MSSAPAVQASFAHKKALQWRSVSTIEQAEELIDRGHICNEDGAKQFLKILSTEQQAHVIQHFAKRLIERVEDRLSSEIIVESILVIFSASQKDELIYSFIEEVLTSYEAGRVCISFAEITLAGDASEEITTLQLVATAVGVVCEMSLGIVSYEEKFPGQIRKAKTLVNQLSTYLLGASTLNHFGVRLALFRYFNIMESNLTYKPFFDKIMGRFGKSVLEYLLQQIFNKKTESLATQFFIEHLECLLEGNDEIQLMLHEAWRHSMLKHPERFSLLLKMMSKHLHRETAHYGTVASQKFFRHIAVLFKVTSDVNHRVLAGHMFDEMLQYSTNTACKKQLWQIAKDDQIRKIFKDMIVATLGSSNQHSQNIVPQQKNSVLEFNKFKPIKRGRKPSINLTEVADLDLMQQISVLSEYVFDEAI